VTCTDQWLDSPSDIWPVGGVKLVAPHSGGSWSAARVTDAETQAARLVAFGQDLAQDGEQRYADAHGAATTAGRAGQWTR